MERIIEDGVSIAVSAKSGLGGRSTLYDPAKPSSNWLGGDTLTSPSSVCPTCLRPISQN